MTGGAALVPFPATPATPPSEKTSMARSTPPPVSANDILRTLHDEPRRWLIPAVVVALASLVFAIARPRVWEASQSLVVRDEVSNDALRKANSSRAEDTKAAQETVLELAHSQSVLRRALEIVGPGVSSAADFPTAREVEELAENIQLTPPKGSEFGKTDIFYLKSQDRDRERALALARTVSEQVQSSFESLRKTKVRSVIQELEKSAALASHELDRSTSELAAMERLIGGSDLGELRIMNELPSGMSDLRNESFAIEGELRKEISEKLQNEQLLAILKAAAVDPGELVACPNSLLNSQPGLKRLKDGLVDAQIKRATLSGSMSPEHPQVQAAHEAAEQIGVDLHSELAIAVRAIEADLRLSGNRIASLEVQKAKLHDRFDKLADIRARYNNLVAMARHRGEILKAAELELAEARSKQATAHTGALLQLIGEPVTGTRPIGPGGATIVLAGIFGGLILGLGLVVLTARPQPFSAEQIANPDEGEGQGVTERILTVPKHRNETRRSSPLPVGGEESLPLLEPTCLGGPAAFAQEPAFATVAGLPTAASPCGPLTFRQALERISSLKNRL